LQARLQALLRRQMGKRQNQLIAGSLSLDPLARIVVDDGQAVVLSRREFGLLHLFMRRAGQVLSQAEILEDLYDLETERELNTIEVLVGRLRRKIGKQRIKTLRGMGYRFEG